MVDMRKESVSPGDDNHKTPLENSEDYIDEFSSHIHSLRRKTQFLRLTGFYIFILSIISVVLSLFLPALLFYITRGGVEIVMVGTISVAIMAMCLIVAYEYRWRAGRAAFEEISDEIQWRRHRDAGDVWGDKGPNESASLGARIALREFARTTDLPLIPGRFGPAIYMLINIAAIAISILV